MKYILAALISFSVTSAVAQNAYRITYDYIPKMHDNRKVQLIFNDTVSFCYIDLKGFSPKKGTKDFGKQIIHHSSFYFPKRDISYSVMGMNKKHPYMFVVNTEKRIWSETVNQKVILGLKCRGMLSVDANGDSLLVYYTSSFGIKAAPFYNYTGLDGVVLEVYEQRNGELMHLMASAINQDAYTISFPKVEIVSQDERNKRVTEARKNEPEPSIIIMHR